MRELLLHCWRAPEPALAVGSQYGIAARLPLRAAVVDALAPVCADRFQRAADAPANLAALRRIDNSSQGDFVEKGGWAGVPGNNSSDRVAAVVKACATLAAQDRLRVPAVGS